jgi:hypothetical protein
MSIQMIVNRGVCMKHRLSSLFLALGGLGLLVSASGCSLLFVTPPPADGRIVQRKGKCTRGVAAPIVDSLVGGLQVARTALAAAADDKVYADPKQPLSRGADIGIGVGLTALFVGSAAYGFINTAECREVEDRTPSGDSERP